MAVSLPTHSQLLRKARKADTKPPGRFYKRQVWLKARRRILAEHPLCAECQRQGRVTLAVDVHHIVDIRNGGALLDADNLECLCHSCHSKKTIADSGR